MKVCVNTIVKEERHLRQGHFKIIVYLSFRVKKIICKWKKFTPMSDHAMLKETAKI